MQVICVKYPSTKEPGAECKLAPEVGDKDIVIDQIERYGVVYYKLARFVDSGFHSRCFAVLPDQDADEIEDAEKEAIVPAPALYGNEHLHPVFQKIFQPYINH